MPQPMKPKHSPSGHAEVSPAQESALSRALSAIRHTEECHFSYKVVAAAKAELSALQKRCSKCMTHVKDGWHSPDCASAYAVFLSARTELKKLQESCPKCKARGKLKESLYA